MGDFSYPTLTEYNTDKVQVLLGAASSGIHERILDLVLSGAHYLVQKVNMAGPHGNSDHNITKLNVPVAGKIQQQPNSIAFSKGRSHIRFSK